MDDTRSDLVLVLVGVGLTLLIASVVGNVLRWRFSPNGENAAIENLNDRVNSWWIMAIVLTLAFMAGRFGVILLFGIASFAALREFMTLTNATRADHLTLVAVFFVVVPVQFYLVWIGWYGLYAIFIPVYVFLFLPIISALAGDTRNFLIRVSEMQWALMICVYCLSHVPALLDLNFPGQEGRGILLIAFFIIVVQLSDVLQYVWGKLIGKRPIAPTLSPSKTIEGFVGGALSATAIGAGLWWMTPFTPWEAALMSLMLTLMGFLGGLVMSSIKRDRGVKDWGHSIAGHGGFVDRLDSIIFAAPLFFHLTGYFWAVG